MRSLALEWSQVSEFGARESEFGGLVLRAEPRKPSGGTKIDGDRWDAVVYRADVRRPMMLVDFGDRATAQAAAEAFAQGYVAALVEAHGGPR